MESLPDTKFTGALSARKPVEEADNKCTICMTEYEEGEVLKTLPCFHKYHKECIVEWFKHQNFCPFCRLEVKQQ